MIIIGLSGPTGSGKDTVANMIKEVYPEALFLRFSDSLSMALRDLGLPVSKENQQWLASIGRERFGTDFIFNALVDKIKGEVVVVNGVRYIDEVDGLREKKAVIWYLDAPAKLRWQRVNVRNEKTDDESSWEDFQKREQADTERNFDAIKEVSNEIIDNSQSIEELKQKVCSLLSKD
jgi:dephospho-CoA kinase